MKSVITHPTPQRVVDACHVVAAWLREIEAAEALISPTGGAAFHGERMADRYLNGWEQAEDRARAIVEAAKKWAAHDATLRDLIRSWEAE